MSLAINLNGHTHVWTDPQIHNIQFPCSLCRCQAGSPIVQYSVERGGHGLGLSWETKGNARHNVCRYVLISVTQYSHQKFQASGFLMIKFFGVLFARVLTGIW